MTELPILYSFRRCPFAMRARMALVASGAVVASLVKRALLNAHDGDGRCVLHLLGLGLGLGLGLE